jgi:UDP-N-acetylglucosamine 2-epimerase (non-hydrolysing)
MHLLVVAGARPNFMKVAPILNESARRGHRTTLVHTGQHYDAAMSDVFFDELGIAPPDFHLGIGSAPHTQQTAAIMLAFDAVIRDTQPDWVVVVGDVNSTLACALVAAQHRVRLAHVESGLRSRDRSMPEELNRIVVDHLSDLLLAPSADAIDNLAAEGIEPQRVALVGNVMIDTLNSLKDRAGKRQIIQALQLKPNGYGLVTMHRPSNVDNPARFSSLIGALIEVSQKIPLIYPAHPRVHDALSTFALPPQFRVIEPVGYLDSIALQMHAALVMTDSGGIQEETTALGIPCLTLRTTTERPITIHEGTNQLVGVEPQAIIDSAMLVLANPAVRRSPSLWDGLAAGRILDRIEAIGPESST